MRTIKKFLSVIMVAAIAFTFSPVVNGQAFAAAKKPAIPKSVTAKEHTDSTDAEKLIDVKWKKAKNAKKYQVAMRSAKKKWIKDKTVKKTKANKKKYTKKNKYKVVAKGKKYIVYKYAYKFSILQETTGRFVRVNQTPTWDDLKPNTKYTFAVRSVNGKKYSAWSKNVSVKTSAPDREEKTITASGKSLKQSIDGTSITFTIGKECTMPVPKPKKGTLEIKPFTAIPKKIHWYLERNKEGPKEEITINGTTPEGFVVYWEITLYGGATGALSYTVDKEGSTGFTEEATGYGPGSYGKAITVQDPAVTVVWATDGTEPKPGQESLSIQGSEYPFAPVTSNSAPYSGSIQVRGTATAENSGTIWSEIGKGLFNKCEWIRAYQGSTLACDHFFYEGYYNN